MIPDAETAALISISQLDVDEEARRLVCLEAELVEVGTAEAPNTRSAKGVCWVVLRDPNGNEFCLGGYPDGHIAPS